MQTQQADYRSHACRGFTRRPLCPGRTSQGPTTSVSSSLRDKLRGLCSEQSRVEEVWGGSQLETLFLVKPCGEQRQSRNRCKQAICTAMLALSQARSFITSRKGQVVKRPKDHWSSRRLFQKTCNCFKCWHAAGEKLKTYFIWISHFLTTYNSFLHIDI